MTELRAWASQDKPLAPLHVMRLDGLAASGDGAVQREMLSQILDCLDKEGLRDAARSLGKPSGYLLPTTEAALLSCVGAYLSQPVSGEMDAARRQAQARCVIAEVFENMGPASRSAAGDKDLVEALVGLARQSGSAGALDICRALVRQPTDRLPLLASWQEMLVEGLASGRLSLSVKRMREVVSEHEPHEPGRRRLMTPLLEALSGAIPLSPAQIDVLRLPAWDSPSVRKEDIAALMLGDGDPAAKAASAQRIIRRLRETEGEALVEADPSSGEGRLSYRLSARGLALRQAIMEG
jgi:hypothetical protein